MSELAMWWWHARGGLNFGDELGPAILTRLGYRVRRVPLHDADLVACGSILEHVHRDGRPGLIVWGSGLIQGGTCDPSRFDVRAVRGRFTAGALGVDVPLGDPGILVPGLWDRPPARHKVGWVPHYLDRRPAPWADLVVDVTGPVDETIAGIGSCASIVASSLHGLIVASAWGIPTMRLPHPQVIGGDYKWIDWATGAGGDPADLRSVLP